MNYMLLWRAKLQRNIETTKKLGIFLRKYTQFLCVTIDYFPWCSSDTVNFLRPLARREASTRRPFFVAMRSRKPCLFTRRRLCGWNVLFIVLSLFICYNSTICTPKNRVSGCKSTHFFWIVQVSSEILCVFLCFFPKMSYLCTRKSDKYIIK